MVEPVVARHSPENYEGVAGEDEIKPLIPESTAKSATVRGNDTIKSYQFQTLMAIHRAWTTTKMEILSTVI